MHFCQFKDPSTSKIVVRGRQFLAGVVYPSLFSELRLVDCSIFYLIRRYFYSTGAEGFVYAAALAIKSDLRAA